MDRIALKIGYLGTRYRGFQVQPQPQPNSQPQSAAACPTIEGELFKALNSLNIIVDRSVSNYSAASRTDSGVHALCQVVSFDTTNPNVTPRMVNSMLPDDIWAFALATGLSSKFNARKDAISREYRYFLWLPPEMSTESEIDIILSRIQEAAELFIGTHDFSNFSQPPGHNEYEVRRYSPVRKIKRIDISAIERSNSSVVIIIDIEADSFLRKMVRMIVTALKMVGAGTRDKQWVEDLVELRMRLTDLIPHAPASGLVLKAIHYRDPELAFVEDEYAKRRIAARIKDGLVFHATIASVLEDMLKF